MGLVTKKLLSGSFSSSSWAQEEKIKSEAEIARMKILFIMNVI
jgi:hypothetical protein